MPFSWTWCQDFRVFTPNMILVLCIFWYSIGLRIEFACKSHGPGPRTSWASPQTWFWCWSLFDIPLDSALLGNLHAISMDLVPGLQGSHPKRDFDVVHVFWPQQIPHIIQALRLHPYMLKSLERDCVSLRALLIVSSSISLNVVCELEFARWRRSKTCT